MVGRLTDCGESVDGVMMILLAGVMFTEVGAIVADGVRLAEVLIELLLVDDVLADDVALVELLIEIDPLTFPVELLPDDPLIARFPPLNGEVLVSALTSLINGRAKLLAKVK